MNCDSRGIFWKAIGLMMLPFVLILKEPDLGSALVLLPTGLVMMFVAGTPRRICCSLVGGVGLLGALLLADVLFAPPALADQDAGLSAPAAAGLFRSEISRQPTRRRRNRPRRARAAVRKVLSGAAGVDCRRLRRVVGQGLAQGQPDRAGFLPPGAAHNDFIFSVIAEEEGFVGSVVVLTLYAVVLFTGIRIAGQARDRLGKLLAVGVVTLLFSHVFINIGMNIRIVPVTGMPLPLLSYGGSSVLGSLIAMGLLQNVYIYRKAY